MNQFTFTACGAGLTQCELVLLRLRNLTTADQLRDGWVNMPDLVAACGGYAVHSRVADLRKRGYDIEQTSVRRARKVHSFYRLRREGA
ncbi:MAG: hypothetical protein FJY48_06690 [Betaproteobacteria bacterium]|nr:hypothetical protein [Betaproteobacteria bacterium]